MSAVTLVVLIYSSHQVLHANVYLHNLHSQKYDKADTHLAIKDIDRLAALTAAEYTRAAHLVRVAKSPADSIAPRVLSSIWLAVGASARAWLSLSCAPMFLARRLAVLLGG